jgi:hypothetical protein
MKLYVDEIREAPDESWTLVRTIGEAVRFIVRYMPEISHISLDHDISYEVIVEGTYRPFPSPETYQPIAHVIGLVYRDNDYVAPKVTIHSANDVGAKEMLNILAFYGILAVLEPMGAAHRKK